MKQGFLILLLLLIHSCAVLDQKNRVILQGLDAGFTPKTTTAKIALSPISIPIGFTAFMIDGLVLHPFFSLPCAIDDSLWAFKEVPNTYILELIVFPMRIVTMLATFAGSEVFRTSIPIPYSCGTI
ncbi:MAG: hypothetical protein H7A25_07730 [Leptospiraceae bacterium]|nr:hypothetical protein [Leptospiraceae bacterium]MCP5499774.1 hypothetical protein [Leptospiraceae bacterium]